MATVTLQQIGKTYDKTPILQDIDLTIADKEFLVLVGPSGCGKSTLLRLIAGLEELTDGHILIDNTLVDNTPPKDRDIAMVFQSYALYPHMSVFDNMGFGLKMRKVAKAQIKQRVEDAAKMLELTHLLDRKPKQLSGGQRQRVALGRAIVRNPKVFLMDEPLSNLDAKLRVQMRTEIQKLHHRLHATTVYVTHDQIEAMTMGDRIVVLHQGRIQQVGEPSEVYQQPANQFVGAFIGQMFFISSDINGQQVHLGDKSHAAPPEVIRALGLTPHKTVTLGIRPEQFSVTPKCDYCMPLILTPELTESLGSALQVHFTLAGKPCAATLPADATVHVGVPVKLYLNLNQVSYFDPETEQNLLRQ